MNGEKSKNKFHTTTSDKLLILTIILASILSLFFIWGRENQDVDLYISIQVDGKEVHRMPLDESTEGKTYAIKTDYGENIIKVENQKVFVEHADCPDKFCMQQGKISKLGQSLVCLPHRVMIELVSDDDIPEVDTIVK